MGDKLYVSNATESTRMFKHPLMEALSKVHFSVPIIIFTPVIIYFFVQGVISPDLSWVKIGLWSVFGLLSWTVVEYVMHRFVFHYHPTSEFGKKLHFIFHGVHHDYPRDRLRLVLPPSVSIPLATGFYFLFKWLIIGSVFYPFFALFLMGYVIYDTFHYAIHHLEVKGKLWNTLKTHHLKHHYVNPDRGYGVSSPLWDKIVHSDFEEVKAKSHLTHSESD